MIKIKCKICGFDGTDWGKKKCFNTTEDRYERIMKHIENLAEDEDNPHAVALKNAISIIELLKK